MRYLIFDISNILHRTFYANRDESDDVTAGLAVHIALTTINMYYNKYKPDRVVMAFDRTSWRKQYMMKPERISKKPYKGNRRKDMTAAQAAKYERFLGHLAEFEALITEQTTVITLAADQCEADDLIAGFCMAEGSDDNEIIIISSDSDLLQLLKFQNVRIVTPDKGVELRLEEYDGDPDLYLFMKCIRGDPTDNIQSAYPRVHTTKIREAYTDPYARTQLMKKTWSDQDGNQILVEEMFAENKVLIDLTQQPDDIKDIIDMTIARATCTKKRFSLFHLLQFVGKYDLVKVKQMIDNYIPMLSK